MRPTRLLTLEGARSFVSEHSIKWEPGSTRLVYARESHDPSPFLRLNRKTVASVNGGKPEVQNPRNNARLRANSIMEQQHLFHSKLG